LLIVWGDLMRRETVVAIVVAGLVIFRGGCPGAAAEGMPRIDSLCARGDSLLAAGDLREAEKAFRTVLKMEEDHAPALNGLGLVFQKTPRALQWAVKYFKRATVVDPAYTEAYYNLARAHHGMRGTKELDAYLALVKANPKHLDGWFQLGRIYKDGIETHFRDPEKAERAYRTQLETNPGHLGARQQLGEVLRILGKTDEAVTMLETVVDTPSAYQRKALLELATAHQIRREYDRAELLFDQYIGGLEQEEQELFYDLSLVAGDRDLERFGQAPRSEWRALSDRFWRGRDPAPVTAANERRIEHCRRVAHAREHFGEYKFPWDARGEVYIRYGEPDHVSASNDIRFEMAPRVVAVKDRLVMMAGKAVGPLMQARAMDLGAEIGRSGGAEDVIGSASTVRRQIAETGYYVYATEDCVHVEPASSLKKPTSSSSILGWPVYPVVDRVWVYWIYTEVGPGIEVTFTQLYHPGPFDYADPPHGIGAPDRSIGLTWQRMNPRVVMSSAAAWKPEVYRPDFATGALDFYFDTATFQGEDDSTAVEVYFGIPVGDLAYSVAESGELTAHVERGVAAYGPEDVPVCRVSEEVELFSEGEVDTVRTAFVPQMERLALAPGEYRLAVQVLDTGSRKSQVYNQEIRVPSYSGDGLRLSSIQLASSITQIPDGRFPKGEVDVVPNPVRAYLPGQPVHVYYEIYGLVKDEFGRTDYRVTYGIRSADQGAISANILRVLGKLLGRRDDAAGITVEYGHTGDSVDEQGYLAFDLGVGEPGEYLLSVSVVDRVGGSRVTSTAYFTVR
jgi:GWxTD domain-containing protein